MSCECCGDLTCLLRCCEGCDLLMGLDRYHHLNHYALFGGGYRGGAMSIMKKLIAKYA